MYKYVRFIAKGAFAFFTLSILWVLSYKWIHVPYTPLMAIRKIKAQENYIHRHQWVPLSEISKNLQLAVICSEDQTFMKHYGFDKKAINKAISDHASGKRLRGASTISQQTAKNVFLWPQRSWVRKGLEVYFTILIETFWSKKRILEVYLNSIEMGDGVFGAQAAANFWFATSAKQLTNQEAAGIAAILPNPKKLMPNHATGYIQKRKKWILTQMHNYGRLSFDND